MIWWTQASQPKKATVIKTEKISANMQGVTLHADEFVDFPEHCEGSYIKLLSIDTA